MNKPFNYLHVARLILLAALITARFLQDSAMVIFFIGCIIFSFFISEQD